MVDIEILKDEVIEMVKGFGYKPVVKEYENWIDIQFYSPGFDSFPRRYIDAISMLVKGYIMEFYYGQDMHHIRLYTECQGQDPDSDRYSCLIYAMNKVKYDEPKLAAGKEVFVNMGDRVERLVSDSIF